MIILIRILFTLTSLGFGSCIMFNSHHHIILDHNISINIEKEVNRYIEGLYQEEPLK